MPKYLLLFLLFSGHIMAQKGTIATDRPDQTECANIVPMGNIQAENGFLIENDHSQGSQSKEIVFFTSLFKYGISRRLEIRLIVENSKIIEKKQAENQIFKGISPIQIGLKVNLIQAKGLMPETSLIVHLGIPKLASESKKQAMISPNFRFAMQHILTEKASLAYNFGAEWNGDNTEPTAIYTLSTSRSIGKKVGMYIEVYGFLPQKGQAQHSFDGGFTFPLSSNFMLDVSASKGLSGSAPNNYISCGLSFRLPTK